MDDAQNEALAALTSQMFAESIATGEVVVDDPAPVAIQVATPAPPTPVAPQAPDIPAPVVVETPAESVVAPENVPTFKPKLSDDLQALLDEPDFEEDARLEVAAEVESDEYDYSDPETTAKVRALEKRNQFLETQLVAKSKKGWVEEAKRAYPDLARLLPGELEAISASSRRAFIREADKVNTRYQTVLAPTLAKLEAERVAIAGAATEVAREEVHASWGKPAGDTLPPLAASQAEALDRARKAGDLTGAIKVLMQDTKVL